MVLDLSDQGDPLKEWKRSTHCLLDEAKECGKLMSPFRYPILLGVNLYCVCFDN